MGTTTTGDSGPRPDDAAAEPVNRPAEPHHLATLLVDLHRRLSQVQRDCAAFRELFSIALTLLHDHDLRIKAQDRTIARLHDERRAARQQEAT